MELLMTILLMNLAVALFTVFDIVGFYHVLTKKTGVLDSIAKLDILVYRGVQTLFQVGLIYVLYAFVNIEAAIGFTLLWWFGLCDLLYYVFSKQEYTKFKTMPWLWWTPLGFINKLRGRGEIDSTKFVNQAVAPWIIINAILIVLAFINLFN